MNKKNRFLGSGFVLTTSLGFGNLAFAQVDNSGDPLRVGVEDANLLVNEYLRPVGIESADVNLKLKGTCPVTLIDDDPGSSGFGDPAIQDFEDLIDLSFDDPNDTRANVGVQLHLGVLAIHDSYTFAKYSGVTVGAGINIR